MDRISYSKARAQLAKTMDLVCETREPIVITRQSGESVVMMPLDEYESLDETAYLMRSPENARRLTKAVRELDAGHGEEHDLIREDQLPS